MFTAIWGYLVNSLSTTILFNAYIMIRVFNKPSKTPDDAATIQSYRNH